MNCWYENTCNKYNQDCQLNCIRYAEMKFLIDNSNIPTENQFNTTLIPSPIDLPKFIELKNIKDNIQDWVANGNNLYIHSQNFGNGKTTWAIKLMLKYFDLIWAGNGFNPRGIFIHTPTFLTKFKEVINKKDDDFEILKKSILDTDLVIWDDIATGKLSDFDHTNLLTYIDQRKLSGKSNIYTGNLDSEELEIAIGNRLKSRVWNDSYCIELKGNDRRGVSNGCITNFE